MPITTDSDAIVAWVERRSGFAAEVSEGETVGALRIGFPGYIGEEPLTPLLWEEFFEKFATRGLAFEYEETDSAGNPSNIHQIVDRR